MSYLKLRPKHPSRRERWPKETWVHLQVVEHIERKRPDLADWYAHPPLGGHRSKRTAMWLRKMGAKPGQPDLMFYKPLVYKGRQYIGLALELKRVKSYTVTKHQREWLHRLEQAGWLTAVTWGRTCSIAMIEAAYPEHYPPVLLLGSEADRRHAVHQCLQHPEWSALPNTHIAAYCGVDERSVRRLRASAPPTTHDDTTSHTLAA